MTYNKEIIPEHTEFKLGYSHTRINTERLILTIPLFALSLVQHPLSPPGRRGLHLSKEESLFQLGVFLRIWSMSCDNEKRCIILYYILFCVNSTNYHTVILLPLYCCYAILCYYSAIADEI